MKLGDLIGEGPCTALDGRSRPWGPATEHCLCVAFACFPSNERKFSLWDSECDLGRMHPCQKKENGGKEQVQVLQHCIRTAGFFNTAAELPRRLFDGCHNPLLLSSAAY